eukprot:Hpha_TRINITY_DN7554_c0_g1::TRINITY_DN7554_c0_g1_i1::g.18787::m.18787
MVCCAMPPRGEQSPVIVDEDVIKLLPSGSVIVDLAAGQGGNTAVSDPEKPVTLGGVTVVGLPDAAGRLPAHASTVWGACTGRLLARLVDSASRTLCIDTNDPLLLAMLVTSPAEQPPGPKRPKRRRRLLRLRPPDPPPADEETERKDRDYGWAALLKLAAPEMGLITAGLVLVVIRVPFSLLGPHYASAAVAGVFKKNRVLAMHNINALVLISTVDIVLRSVTRGMFAIVQSRFVRRTRINLFCNLLRQDAGFFDATPCGALASRLEADVVAMAEDLYWLFSSAVEAPFRLSFIVCYLLYQSPALGAVALCLTPVAVVINQVYAVWVHENAKEVQQNLASANHVAMEALAGANTVAASGGEKYEQRRYATEANKVYSGMVARSTYQSIRSGGVDACFVATRCGVLIYGVHLCLRATDPLDPQVLMAFTMYQDMYYYAIDDIFGIIQAMERSTGAGRRVFSLLERRSVYPRPVVPVAPATEARPHVIFRNVSFSYPGALDAAVLTDVSLEVLPGQIVAIVGPSGAGKSTLVHLLKRRYAPDSGEITIDGVNVRELSPDWSAQRVALVDQEPDLFAGTITYNILYPALCIDTSLEANLATDESLNAEWTRRVQAAADAADATAFIEELPYGFDTDVGDRGMNLSGGQKQRIALARALLTDPLLLLLDEATSALDAETERRVMDSLTSSGSSRTTVVVAQRLSAVQRADVIFVLNGGAVYESGTPEELAKKAPTGDGGVSYRMLLGV